MGSRAALDFFAGAMGLGRRRTPRYTVLHCVKLITTTGEHPATMRDLSLTGALVEGANLPPPGTYVFLTRGMLEIFAHVVWADGNRSGIEFEEPLSETELLAQVNPPEPSTAFQPHL